MAKIVHPRKGFMAGRPRRKPWPVFAAQCLLVLAVIVGGGSWFTARYGMVIASGKPCLPGKLFLVLKQERQVCRDCLVAFRADNRAWPYPPDARFVKLVRGGAGDTVEIDNQGNVVLTGPGGYEFRASLEPQVMALLHKELPDFAARYEIPPGSYFVMGTLPDSYDSRYWGLVGPEQVVGRARRIF